MRRLVLLLALGALVLSGTARAVVVIQPLSPFNLVTPTGSTNRLTLTLRETQTIFRLSDTETTNVTGSLQGDIRLDVVGNVVTVTGLSLNGGQFALSNVTFNIGFGSVTATTNNIRGTIDTIPAFGTVTGGQFNTADHEITLNQGNIAIDGREVTPANVDLSQDPLTLTANSTGTVVLSVLSSSSNRTNYLARITIPVNVTEPIEGQPAELSASGNLVAEGRFSINFGPNGDYNQDGMVDAADYTIWRDSRGTANPLADGNGDGSVNAADYQIWRNNFGTSSSGSLGTSPGAVPEPASVGLAMCLLAIPFARRIVRR